MRRKFTFKVKKVMMTMTIIVTPWRSTCYFLKDTLNNLIKLIRSIISCKYDSIPPLPVVVTSDVYACKKHTNVLHYYLHITVDTCAHWCLSY